ELVLEEEDRVVVSDGGLDQALGVVRGRRLHDLQPRRVGEVRLGVLRMERPSVHATAGRTAYDERDADASPVPRLRGEIGDHVEGTGDEVYELRPGDGAHSHHRGTDRGPDDGRFGERRVDDALLAELLDQTVGDFEGASVDADVFAQQEHALIAGHLLANAGPDRVHVGRLSFARRAGIGTA